jgi:hypothetical protein
MARRKGGLGARGRLKIQAGRLELEHGKEEAEKILSATRANRYEGEREHRRQREALQAQRYQNPSNITASSHEEIQNIPSPEDWIAFDSSRIVEAAYNRDDERLYVRFVKPRPGGTPWTYESVPYVVWEQLQNSESPGRFVNRVLNFYDYHRGNWG